MSSDWISSLAGGVLIGLATASLLVTHGRIAGISGVVGRLVAPRRAPDRTWRLAFVVGLAVAGIVAAFAAPESLGPSPRGLAAVVTAGLLVGVGTQLGSGCTSGHGVCGLARGSRRSLVAVVTFLVTGAATAALSRGVA